MDLKLIRKVATLNVLYVLVSPHVHEVHVGEDEHQDGAEEGEEGEGGDQDGGGVSLGQGPPAPTRTVLAW